MVNKDFDYLVNSLLTVVSESNLCSKLTRWAVGTRGLPLVTG